MGHSAYYDGTVKFKDKESMQRCLDKLKESNWINGEGGVVIDYPCFGEPSVSFEDLSLAIDGELRGVLERMFRICRDFTSEIDYTWASPESPRMGGVVRSGQETQKENLVAWAVGHSDAEIRELGKQHEKAQNQGDYDLAMDAVKSLAKFYVQRGGER